MSYIFDLLQYSLFGIAGGQEVGHTFVEINIDTVNDAICSGLPHSPSSHAHAFYNFVLYFFDVRFRSVSRDRPN